MQEVAEGFFFFLTQITLSFKIEKFYRNRHRIRKLCEKNLRSSLFCPTNEEEDAYGFVKLLLTYAENLKFKFL